MIRKTESDLDKYLEHLDSPIPDSFVATVMENLDANEQTSQQLLVDELHRNRRQKLRGRFKSALDSVLMLIGAVVGVTQAIAFVFGVWSVTTLG